MKIKPDGMPCTLLECPPGLFLFGPMNDLHLGLKTEYGASNPHNLEVYVAESGEVFWGGTDSKKDRADLIVIPAVADPSKAGSSRHGATTDVSMLTKQKED